MNKRVFCVLMTALLLLCLCACGGAEQDVPAATEDRSTPIQTVESPRTPEETEIGTKSDRETSGTETPSAEETEVQTEAATEDSTELPPEETAETGTEPVTEAPAQTDAVGQPDTSSDEAAPTETEENSPDFADEEALTEYLLGAWNFYPTEEDDQNTPEIGGIPGLSIQLAPGGMFMAIEHMTNAMYFGTWELDRLYAGPDELPDWLRFTLDEPGENLWGFGDYLIQGWARCRGSDRLSLVQVNNGDSVFYNRFDCFDVMLVKGGDFPTEESADPQTDAHFCAMVWQVADDGNTLWVTEVDPADFTVGIGSHEAVRYHLADDCEILCPSSAFAPGGRIAELETNAAGEISMINWAEPELEG